MKIEQLKQFFQERPQLTAFGTAKETNGQISPRLLDYVLKGKKKLTQRTIDILLPILKKYGYEELH